MSEYEEDIRDMIKDYSLKELKEEAVCFEDIDLIVLKFKEYEFKDDYIYGIEMIKKLDMKSNKLFSQEYSLDLILTLYNLADTIYNNINDINKYYNEIHLNNGTYYNKPNIEIDMDVLLKNDKIKNKIISYFNKYGFLVSRILIKEEKYLYNLKPFIRRLLDFYYTFNLWQELAQKNWITKETFNKFACIIDPFYRSMEKEKLYIGIVNNIQEKGLFNYEAKEYIIYEYLYYDTQSKQPQIKKCSNDYMTLAYYQLSRIVVNKPNGIPFKKCKRPGCDNYLTYRYKNKDYCEDAECVNIRNTAKVQRHRKKPKKEEEE